MFLKADKAETLLKELVQELDPDILKPAAAATLFQQLARMERMCSGAKTLLAPRAADSGAWRAEGDQSPAHWVAKSTGTSVGAALGVLETGKRLKQLSGTEQAVRDGKLSAGQVKEICSAAAADPSSEADLLKAAEDEPIGSLRQRCMKVKASSSADEIGRHEAIRRSRYLRHYTDFDGAFRLEGRFTPEAGAAFLAALEPFQNQVFADARSAGRKEPYNAYAADALLAMAEDARTGRQGSARSSPSATIHVRVDHSALIRGHAIAGETCEIPGIGPIPVATVKAMEADAYLWLIVAEGSDIKAVCRSGRHIPPSVRAALQHRDPTCVVPRCETRHRLEIDHTVPVARGGMTRLENLARLCSWHHYLKTHQGFTLAGGPGKWEWIPPQAGAPPGH